MITSRNGIFNNQSKRKKEIKDWLVKNLIFNKLLPNWDINNPEEKISLGNFNGNVK